VALLHVGIVFGDRLMGGRFKRLYPFVFIVLPILNVLVRNPGGPTLSDVAGAMLVMLVLCAVLYGAATLTLRRWADQAVVPVVVLAAIVWFYAYPALRRAYHVASGAPGRMILTTLAVVALALAVFAAIWWLTRRPALLDRVNTFFAIMSLLLVAFLGAQVVADQIRTRSQLRASALVKQLSRPIVPKYAASSATGKPLRDIYLIVLDEYASSSVLAERFGFDNRVFEDSLRQIGFTVPSLVRSNYVHTLLSLPSLLNFSHLSRLEAELGPQAKDPTLPNYLVENNRTAAFLKRRGYQFVFYPSLWWISTEHNRNADLEFQAWPGFDLAREASRSDLWRAFVGRTPFALFQSGDAHDADHVRRTLGAVERLPDVSGPTFAFAHILNPHYPYVFDASCKVHRARRNRSWGRGREKEYLGQVQCLNSLLLNTVTQLLRRSSPAPIILLVGDHGTNSLGYSEAKSAEAVSPVQARERFGAFGAFYLPAGGERLLPDSVTLVNLFPRVLNHYFQTGIALAPDSLYMSLEHTPYMLAPVDPASLARRR
jgi:hypothetical protein